LKSLKSTGSYRYYLKDHLGNVRALRDQNKASLASYEYTPYGEMQSQTGLAVNRGFTGHVWDAEANLYFAPYRYYSPVMARWTERDPLGMVDGFNLYEYSMSHPVVLSDPSGMAAAGNGGGPAIT
jgi:RHS repeat-associated protein